MYKQDVYKSTLMVQYKGMDWSLAARPCDLKVFVVWILEMKLHVQISLSLNFTVSLPVYGFIFFGKNWAKIIGLNKANLILAVS